MAHEVRYLPFLLGIGVRALSMDPLHLPRVQRALAAMAIDEAEALARTVLAQTTAGAVGEILDAEAARLFGPADAE
jgi:phosphotransferase system enzyme I (PtsP)